MLRGKAGGVTANWRYHLLALLTIVIWGTTFVSTKILLQAHLTPSGIFVARFALAYVGMVLYTAFTANGRSASNMTARGHLQCVVAGVCGGSLYFLTENTALVYAGAAMVSLIVCLAPAFTALLGVIVMHRRPSWRLICGMAISLVGVTLIIAPPFDTLQVGVVENPLLGGLLALAAAVLWAVYQHIVAAPTKRYGSLRVTRAVFGYGLLSFFIADLFVALLGGGEDGTVGTLGTLELTNSLHLLLSPLVVTHLLFLGLVASLLCYLVWNVVVARLGAVRSANYIYLNPLVTCLFSAVFLGERLTPLMLLGGAACILGVALAQSDAV